jgi:hypothetical protein
MVFILIKQELPCGLVAFGLSQWGLGPKVGSCNGKCLGLLAWVLLDSLVRLMLSYDPISFEGAPMVYTV